MHGERGLGTGFGRLLAGRASDRAVSNSRFEEDPHGLRIKVLSGLGLDMLERALLRPSGSIWAIRRQRIPHVHHGEDAGIQWDFFAVEAAGIPGAIPLLVMTVGNIHRQLSGRRWAKAIS